MPCRSEYMALTKAELEDLRVAELIDYVCRQLNVPVPGFVVARFNEKSYGIDERLVPEMCRMLKSMDRKARDLLVYNARSRTARDLADWWEDHQAADAAREKADAAREKREKKTAEETRKRKAALAKLTPEEKSLLGWKGAK